MPADASTGRSLPLDEAHGTEDLWFERQCDNENTAQVRR